MFLYQVGWRKLGHRHLLFSTRIEVDVDGLLDENDLSRGNLQGALQLVLQKTGMSVHKRI